MSSIKNLEDRSKEKNRVLAGTLYLVATPIGNLADLSERAIKVLSEVDFIAAEDTRNSMRLLTHLGISKPMVSYFEHNKRERGEQIAARLENGESCALITDAGTPAISDPGEDMVALCAERGIPMTSVPGPVASIVALTLSGLPTGRFTFEGFLSTNKPSRKEHLDELRDETRTMIFYEAPHKLKTTLKDMQKVFGDREIAIVKELTKIHETVMRTTLGGACEYFDREDPRGEYVLILAGAEKQKEKQPVTLEQAVLIAKDLVSKGVSVNEAAKAVAADTGIKKSLIYKELL